MKSERFFQLCLLSLLGAATVSGENVVDMGTDSAAQRKEPPITISLVTFYPGSEIFAVYGHTELRVQQGDNDMYFNSAMPSEVPPSAQQQGGDDWYFNYGVFDFNSPGFIYRFVSGQTDYLCAALPKKYATVGMEGRKMVEQRLNLTPEQARRVRDLLYDNALPGNNTYRYRYLSDNCAIRPRDIIEQAVGSTLCYDTTATAFPHSVTFRQMIGHYTAHYPWTQFGIDLVLGCALDTAVTYRQRLFSPLELMQAAAGATIERNGERVPLVAHSQVVVDGSEQGTVLPPTPWPLRPLAVTLAVLLATLGVSLRDMRRGRATRWADTLLFGTAGLLGLLVWYLLLFSSHEATSPNWNALWLHPFHLLAAGCVWLDRRGRLLHACHWGNATIMLLTLGLWPLLPQTANVAAFPLMAALLVRSLAHIFISRRRTAVENSSK